MIRISNILIVLVIIIISLAGGRFTSSGMEWYKTISLPAWTPPGAIIGSVWTVIYILTAISAIMIWNRAPGIDNFKVIELLFILNGVFNLLWSYLFFAKQQIGPAVIDSLAIEATLLLLIALIWKHSVTASLLLVPYALWVGFATYLNFTIFLLNKE